jgi:mono/diheme cytochrome c family protein
MNFPRAFSAGLVLTLSVLAYAATAPVQRPARPPHPLVWDAMEQTLAAKPGDKSVDFEFSVTNSSDRPVQIVEIRTSCGCTVAEMPKSPWVLEAGGRGSFRATVDIRGRHGRFSKTMLVASNAGGQVLGVMVDIPEAPRLSREENLQLATGDRQAVFHGACYSCHVEPIGGKQGQRLYQAACSICHEAEPRATMVPDLTVVREPRDAGWWRRWIGEGRENTLMPGFAEKHGGPLSDAQVESLVEFALKHFPTEPAKN